MAYELLLYSVITIVTGIPKAMFQVSRELEVIKIKKKDSTDDPTSLCVLPIDVKSELVKEESNKHNVDKLHFKAVARQKFDAVLKHEINSRRASNDTNFVSRENTSQFFRIENAKIFSINDLHPKTDVIKESLTSDVNIGPKLITNNASNDSIRHFQTSKLNRDSDAHVFIYDPLLISSDTLNYIGTENILVNSSSSKQDQFLNDNDMESGPEVYSDSVFRCFLCPYFHVKEMMIARHWVQMHLSHNVYICPYCDSSFLTNYLAMKHILETHENEPMKIEIKKSNQFAVRVTFDQKNKTGLQALDKFSIDGKDKTTTMNVNVKCHKCNLECRSIADLQDHHKHVHIHFRPYSCGMCNSRVCFTTRIDLEHHVKITHPNVLKETSEQCQDSLKHIEEADVIIDWSQTCIISDKGKTLKCKWCDFHTTVSKEICQHALKVHHWSKSIKCPKCDTSHEMKDEHYRKGKVLCSKCPTSIIISHDMNGNNSLLSTTTLYKCNTCNYKTSSKGSICRHLKYSHSQCRPFCCPYCPYEAVERPKIRTHILALHPGEKIKAIEKVERNDAFKKSIGELFRQFVITEKVEFLKNAYSGEIKVLGNKQIKDSNTFFECAACKFTSDNVNEAKNHSCHQDRPEVKEQISAVTFGEHFKCISCSYRCYDRSCMARHVKYKHLTSRPHQCPHCPYNNVEKTKVRLHIGSNHPLLQKGVKTNHHLLEQMSLEAKKFYTRVDANGY